MTSFEAYKAHMSNREPGWACSCTEERVGMIRSTMKLREDGDRAWYEGESCAEGARLWVAVAAEASLVITPFGEALTMYPGMSPIKWEDSTLSTCIGVHEICGSFVDFKNVAPKFAAIVCRGCGLRVVIPNTLKKISDLRAWAKVHLVDGFLKAMSDMLLDGRK